MLMFLQKTAQFYRKHKRCSKKLISVFFKVLLRIRQESVKKVAWINMILRGGVNPVFIFDTNSLTPITRRRRGNVMTM